jgi:hypothetical protein
LVVHAKNAFLSPFYKKNFFFASVFAPSRLRGSVSLALLLTLTVISAADQATSAPSAYFNDFQKTSLGKPPDDLLIMNGDFTIAEQNGTRFLQLPGDPLDTFGLLFGPADKSTLDISAKIWADVAGKRLPEFAIGSNDAGGYKLWLWPATGTIELRKADDTKASKPFVWNPATWLHLRLRVRQLDSTHWRIEGKAWPDTASEPKDWLLSFDDTEEPSPGRASIWGEPFSGKPIRYMDLSAKPAGVD